MLKWRESYNLGIKSIDQQHKKWIELMNAVLGAFYIPGKTENIEKLLNDVNKFAHAHFDYEEKLFKKISYKYEEEHCQQHLKFYALIEEQKKKLKAGEIKSVSELVPFFQNWLLQHISVEDKKYVKEFQLNHIE